MNKIRYYVKCQKCKKRIEQYDYLCIVGKKLFCSVDCAFKYFTDKKIKKTILIPEKIPKRYLKTESYDYNKPEEITFNTTPTIDYEK